MPPVPGIPADYHDLFEKPTIAHLSTLLPDGAPHSAPVWIDHDAETDRLLVNTERGRRKEKNVRNDPRVAVSMTDPDNPYRMLSVRGEVAELTTDGAREHIDELARRYTGADEYQTPIQTERIILTIEVEHVATKEA
jgi:PPOX class probable F420-dependent enzyme